MPAGCPAIRSLAQVPAEDFLPHPAAEVAKSDVVTARTRNQRDEVRRGSIPSLPPPGGSPPRWGRKVVKVRVETETWTMAEVEEKFDFRIRMRMNLQSGA